MLRMLLVCTLLGNLQGLHAQFQGNQTPTYPKLVAFYDSVARKHPRVELYAMGSSDYSDWPIYLCVLNGAQDSLLTFEKARSGTTLLINNGIHPGEPDGINACGQLTLDYLQHPERYPQHTVIAFVLCYNVGGAMNRSSMSRANQDGPAEYGFRGNAQNLDLNRDFIKMDAENTFTFARIFHALDPDVLVDTHVSNGADYQYTLTLIHSISERMAPSIRQITYQNTKPALEKALLKKKLDLAPYMELRGETPAQGIEGFNDLPRYSMGYASLFHTISITTETHMLKPFEARVAATKTYLEALLGWMEQNSAAIETARQQARTFAAARKMYAFNYKLSEVSEPLLFKGYEAVHPKSLVTGKDRLHYDRKQPYIRTIPYFNRYIAEDSVQIPAFYIVGAQCRDVIERLKMQGVAFETQQRDTTLLLTIVRVHDYKQGDRPYEGHYLHRQVKYTEEQATVSLKKGDLWIPTDQARSNFIVSVLDPATEDSYFAWNFFDSYLQQKEYFSDYVFEDIAAELLEKNPELRKRLQEKQASDLEFSRDTEAQLYFIYQNSPYFEPTFHRLPVFKVY
jgi:hypothetical protein